MTSIQNLKARIKETALRGRALRAEALTLSGMARHQKQLEALGVGETARCLLLAYTLLRGRDISTCEGNNTRRTFRYKREFAKGILEEFYTPREGLPSLLDLQNELGHWSTVIDLWGTGYEATR